MRAIGVRLLVEPTVGEVKMEIGLLLSRKDVGENRYKKGCVISVGESIKDIKKGDRIHYDKSAGNSILEENTLLDVIQYRDVVLVDDDISLFDKLINTWKSLFNK